MKVSTGGNNSTAAERRVLFGSQAEKTSAETPTPEMHDVVLSAGVATCGHDAQWAHFLQQPTKAGKNTK